MKKSTKALIGITGLAAGFGVAMNQLILTRASKAISDKNHEKEDKKNPPDPTLQKNILGAEGDAWVDTKDYDHIVIKNRSNESIHALTVKADEPSDKWLICIHGYTSSPKGMGSYGLHYHKKGYNILFPALRGHDISEHRSITMGWLDRFDIIDWINYIIEIYGENVEIVLHGVSMGAATVMMTTGENLPNNVKCAVADCGYSSVWDEFKNEMKVTYHVPAFPALYIGDIATRFIFKRNSFTKG
jgi:pimeloyl-ACP methyl ester carboxylesterase